MGVVWSEWDGTNGSSKPQGIPPQTICSLRHATGRLSIHRHRLHQEDPPKHLIISSIHRHRLHQETPTRSPFVHSVTLAKCRMLSRSSSAACTPRAFCITLFLPRKKLSHGCGSMDIVEGGEAWSHRASCVSLVCAVHRSRASSTTPNQVPVNKWHLTRIHPPATTPNHHHCPPTGCPASRCARP